MDPKVARQGIILAAAIVTVLTAGPPLWRWVGEDYFEVLFVDEVGFPRVNLVIETPDGPRSTCNGGTIIAKSSWIGKQIIVKEEQTGRWIMSLTLERRRGERIVKLVVPRRDTSAKTGSN